MVNILILMPVEIIGQEQVDYMLEKFQNEQAITEQLAEGYEYYLVGAPTGRAGYFAFVPCPDQRSLQLSKLYLRRASRGRGLGRGIVHWLESECRARALETIWLTVNKDNADSIAFYERAGFQIEDATVFDIGDGFVMDDYRMAKRLGDRLPPENLKLPD